MGNDGVTCNIFFIYYMNRSIVGILIFIVFCISIYFIVFWREKNEDFKNDVIISSFEECVTQGNPVMESYPRQCRSGDEIFVEDVGVRDDEGDRAREIDEQLVGKKWMWLKTEMNNDTSITPKNDGVFSVSFESDGNVRITTDCNAAGGSYVITDNQIIFGDLRATMMYCDDAQEREFMQMIREVDQYLINDEGQLVLLLKFDTGAIYFQ